MNIVSTSLKRVTAGLIAFASSILIASSVWANTFSWSEDSSDYLAIPPFLSQGIDKPNVMIALDVSGSMTYLAYPNNGDAFNPNKAYYGYFTQGVDSTDLRAAKFTYKQLTIDGVTDYYFVPDANGEWDGNFLNWLSMRRMDVVRQVLVGGNVRDRNGEQASDGKTYYVVQAHNEQSNKRAFEKRYINSSAFSPFPNNTFVTLNKNATLQTGSANTVPVTDKLEIGSVTVPADKKENNAAYASIDIEFSNEYDDPVVVASIISHRNKVPVTTYVSSFETSNGKTTGATIRLQEYPYEDQDHPKEIVHYAVAERGTYEIPLTNGEKIHFVAGYQNINAATDDNTGTTLPFGRFSDTNNKPNPFTNGDINVFTGVGSGIHVVDKPLVTRVDAIDRASFIVEGQPQELSWQHHLSERFDFIAIERGTGITETGVTFESGSADNFTNEKKQLSFTSSFVKPPEIIAGMITKNDTDTANLRYTELTESAITLFIQEEKSLDRETNHGNENIGYLAVSAPEIKLQIAQTEEPKGIIQDRQHEFRFGTTVYNFDHTKDDIFNGNTVHGGTMYPCYPDNNGNTVCKRSDVRAPLTNVMDVIEDHPLIWGSTPIAEAMYDIWGYFQQVDFNRNGNQPQYYANGHSSKPSYYVSDAWDPYQNDDKDILTCTKSYVLNFNDGAPVRDFDGDGHPTLRNALTPAGKGNTQALDEVAHMMRTTDARPPGSRSVDGFQGITSFYVFAGLGSNEQNNTSAKKMREAAAAGGFTDLDNDNELDGDIPSDFQAYYSKASTPDKCKDLGNEWDTDEDCNPDGFFYASDGEELKSSLVAALDSFALTSSSGGAASLVSTTTTGTGAFVRGLFSATGASNTIPWAGDINALMIDKSGLLRSDDGDGILENYATDKILDTCYSNSGTREVKVFLSDSPANRPSAATLASCTTGGNESDIGYLWSAKDWLSDNTLNAADQRPYGNTGKQRHIFTWLDNNTNGDVESSEVVSFLPSLVSDDNAGLWRATSTAEAENIVKYTRGEVVSSLRNRTLGNKVLRLGDSIYSTPTPVARPAENLDLLYKDSTYLDFVTTYKNRRQVVYAGTNDGMLHAFNGGYFNEAYKRFDKAPPSPNENTTYAEYDLGAEMWAYVPYNLLPHLKYLAKPTYGQGDGDHLYMMDQPPRIFDAKIFCTGEVGENINNCLAGQSNTSHPHGWGTVLVAGMRLGGGKMTVDPDNDPTTDNNRVLRSAYVIMDITNPEQPPRLLKEFSHPELGFTTSEPTPLVIQNDSGSDWYMAMGSGPSFGAFTDVRSTQSARLFLLNLKTMALENSFGTDGVLEIDSAPNSFVGDILATDFNLDATTDSLYFGTVESKTRDSVGNTTEWGGSVYRLNIQNFSTSANTTRAITDWAAEPLLQDAGPVTSKLSVTFDNSSNRWLYAGTGRFYNLADAASTAQQYAYGLKEPRNTDGDFTLAAINPDHLLDVTDAEVRYSDETVSGLTSYLGSNNTVTRLDRLMQGFADNSTYRAGWKMDLDSRERVIGTSSLLAGTLSFTPYAPPAESCTFEGNSTLYSLRYTTGTAWRTPTIGLSDSNTTTRTILKSRQIGVTPVATISPHAGEPGTNKIIQNTQSGSGEIIQVNTDSDGTATSSETDWRQL